MKKSLLKVISASLLSLCVVVSQTPIVSSAEINTTQTEESKPLSVGYFYEGNGDINNIDVNKLTNLIYSFGGIYHHEVDGATYPSGYADPSYVDDENLIGTLYLSDKVKDDLRNLDKVKAKNPDLKISLAIGGYAARGFSGAALTKESRAKLVDSIVDAVKTYKLDGIDIDWEVPVNGGWGTIDKRPEDKYNFTYLLQDLKTALGEDIILSVAAPVSGQFYTSEWCEFDKVCQIVDYMNVMIYDLAFAGPEYNSALHATTKDSFTTSWGMNGEFLTNSYVQYGCPKEKLVFGVPFYGRIPMVNNQPKYFSESELKAMGFEKFGSFNPTPSYPEILNLIGKNGIEERWDDEAKVPYLVHVDPTTKKETFLMQYENAKSVAEKAKYAKEQGFAGTMVWEVNQDDSNSTLISSIYSALGYNNETSITDINNDGSVDILDLSLVADNYNTSAALGNLDKKFDLNNDGIVDLFDLVIVARDISI